MYIDDFLCISTSTLDGHVDKLRQVLIRLCDTNLKVDPPKSFLCSTKYEYLGYDLTREGIGPRHKTIEAIIVLLSPKNVKGLRCFLGTVQYYRDIWEKRSNILVPLTDLAGECGVT